MKTIFTFFIFSLLSFSSKAQWVELDTGMENPPVFNDVYAITPDIVVVVGANGTILKTTDGGETWVQKPSGTTDGLGKVQFPTPEIGYITGSNGKLLKTTDGGETWATINLGENVILNSLSCVNEDLIFISGIITGSGNRLLKSEDGGETWDNFNELPLYGEIQFLNNEIGYAGEESGGFLKTENGGEAWQELTNIFPPFNFLNENIGFYYSYGLYKTIDGGNNFGWVSEGLWSEFGDIYVINENCIWGILGVVLDGDGSTRGIIKMTSSGTDPYLEDIWYENNPEIDMFSIHFADETTGYIVGTKNSVGAIWKNGTGINTMGVKDEVLDQTIKVYPNPVSKEININIEFNKETSDNYTILFTDLTGKQLYSKSFNEPKIKINIAQFPKGIYMLSVKTKQGNFSQKIIIN